MTTDEILGIQNSLIDAAQKQQQSSDAAIKAQQQLAQQQINVANNAAGTLFSTRPTFQGAQLAASDYIPAITQNATTFQKTNIDTKNTVADALKQIQSYNDAAARLMAGKYASV